MEALVDKAIQSLFSQGPSAVILAIFWILWVKPRINADVERVKIEGEAAAKKSAMDAESNKIIAESMKKIAAAVDKTVQDSEDNRREIKKIVCYTAQGIKGTMEDNEELTREALAGLYAIARE